MKRVEVLIKDATRVSGLALFAAKCCGDKPADVLSQIDSRKRRNIPSTPRVRQGDALGPVLFCLSLGIRRGRLRAQFEPMGSLTWQMSVLPF